VGFFDLLKGEKKKVKSAAKKQSVEAFELGQTGVLFNSQIQIVASPKAYAQKVAREYVEAIKVSKDLKQNKKYHVVRSRVSQPTKLKKREKEEGEADVDLFKVLIDLEVGVKDRLKMFDFCFEFMPFSIEVIQPMNITLSAADLTEYLTSIQATLHKIDNDFKKANAANQVFKNNNETLTKNMIQMLKNNVLLSLREKDKDSKELAKNVGIPEEQLKPFLEKMIAHKDIKIEKNKYSIVK